MPTSQPESTPTATALVAADEMAADALALQEVFAHLRPFLAKKDKQLPCYRGLWEDAAPIVKAAQRENLNLLTAKGLPDRMRTRFEMVLGRIAGLGDDIARVEAKVHALAELTGARVRRTAWERAANTWPGAVQGVIAACLMLNEPVEEKRKKLEALRAEHATLVSWARGVAGTPPPMTAKEPIRSEPLRTELAFDPMKTP